mmetsp:Transcript_18396/g.42453  ORF Transcript_18396/g.42453 Transcript_18396/m.42453 type:complete len:211 (+) Transcript_18396:1727-2359(+)
MSKVVKGVVVVASLTTLMSKYKRRFSPGFVIIAGSIGNKVVMGRACKSFGTNSELPASSSTTKAHSMSMGIPYVSSIKQTKSVKASIFFESKDDFEYLGSFSSIVLLTTPPDPIRFSLPFFPMFSSIVFRSILSTMYRSAVTLPSTTDSPNPQLESMTISSRSELRGFAEKATPAITESIISMTVTAKPMLLPLPSGTCCCCFCLYRSTR